MSGSVALPLNCMHGAISHASRRSPDVILRRSFTRPSTTLAVIEGLGTRLHQPALFDHSSLWLFGLQELLHQREKAHPERLGEPKHKRKCAANAVT